MTTRTMTARTKSFLLEQMGADRFHRTYRLIERTCAVIDGQTRTLLVFEVMR